MSDFPENCNFFIFIQILANPGLFFIDFQSIQLNNRILQQFEKCPSSIGRRDSNSQPSGYESPPLTSSPRIPL